MVGKVLHDVDEKFALLDLDAFVQGLHGVVVQHRDGTLGEDPSGVDAGVDHEDRRPGDLDLSLIHI